MEFLNRTVVEVGGVRVTVWMAAAGALAVYFLFLRRR